MASMAVLSALERQGPLTITELAAHEHVRPPSMTRTINKLELMGCVSRTPHTRDGRAVVVSITDKGCEHLLKDQNQRDAWLARILAELSQEDREALTQATPILEALSHTPRKWSH
ncbi:hypothetical protein GCM10027090_40390 [Sinomonas soli]